MTGIHPIFATYLKFPQHAMKDCIYEGLGGRRFVRVRRRSLLGLLYPCHSHSPDRCVFCHESAMEHKRAAEQRKRIIVKQQQLSSSMFGNATSIFQRTW